MGIMELAIAPTFEISLLRILSLGIIVVIAVTFGRGEIAGFWRRGFDWVRTEAERCRELPGYVGALLGRYSILMAGSSLVFAVFRSVNFEGAEARFWASILAALSIGFGVMAGVAVLAITAEVIKRSKRD